jgi:hypothetical protein
VFILSFKLSSILVAVKTYQNRSAYVTIWQLLSWKLGKHSLKTESKTSQLSLSETMW